jgi:hypothetical protein
VRLFVAGRGKIIAPEFVEVESGKRNDRPKLEKALKRCRATGATLVVVKLDRLSRNAAFLFNLRDSEVQFVAADAFQAASGPASGHANREVSYHLRPAKPKPRDHQRMLGHRD